MIRPRIGNFVYNDDEIAVMLEDIKAFKEEGVTGFVFGCLDPGANVATDTLYR
jgi:copper homeostasis protein